MKISFFLFDKEMCILIGKTLKYFHVIGKTNILLTWSYTIVNCIKEDNALKTCYFLNLIEIPNHKGANSYKSKKQTY